MRIALAGNPNSGKTTMYNALTGSNEKVGNWAGVTVEKKEGRIKKYDGVTVVDLPGIYSLSPYTLEEVVARNYLIGERPDVILNIVDGTCLERNLYLTTQLMEIGVPVVIAINMMDPDRRYVAVLNDGTQVNVQLSLLLDALNTFEGTLKPGESKELVLVYQVKLNSKDDIKHLDIIFADDEGTETKIRLK